MKTVKSVLFKELVKHTDAVEVIPVDSTWIVDAIVLIHLLKVDTTMTYKELAHLIFTTLVRGTSMSSRINWVVDTYPSISIKNPERNM